MFASVRSKISYSQLLSRSTPKLQISVRPDRMAGAIGQHEARHDRKRSHLKTVSLSFLVCASRGKPQVYFLNTGMSASEPLAGSRFQAPTLHRPMIYGSVRSLTSQQNPTHHTSYPFFLPHARPRGQKDVYGALIRSHAVDREVASKLTPKPVKRRRQSMLVIASSSCEYSREHLTVALPCLVREHPLCKHCERM